MRQLIRTRFMMKGDDVLALTAKTAQWFDKDDGVKNLPGKLKHHVNNMWISAS